MILPFTYYTAFGNISEMTWNHSLITLFCLEWLLSIKDHFIVTWNFSILPCSWKQRHFKHTDSNLIQNTFSFISGPFYYFPCWKLMQFYFWLIPKEMISLIVAFFIFILAWCSNQGRRVLFFPEPPHLFYPCGFIIYFVINLIYSHLGPPHIQIIILYKNHTHPRRRSKT